MNVTPGAHTLVAPCPKCGTPLALRFSVRAVCAFADVPGGWFETRVRMSNLSTPHLCTDPDQLALIDAASLGRQHHD